MLSGKILARHLDRQAVVYVRQSTLQQLEHHRELTRFSTGWSTMPAALAGRARGSPSSTMISAAPAPRLRGGRASSGWSPKSALATSASSSASRSRASPVPAATGTSCSRSARWPAR